MFRLSHAALVLLVVSPALYAQNGALKLAEGRFGKALDARATPVVVDGSERFRKAPLTVECWAKLNSKTGFNVLVACDTKDSAEHWEIYSYAGSGAFSVYMPGMQPSEIISKADICDGKWHYLAMTWDGKDSRLFVDGKQVHEQTVQPKKGLKPQPGPLTIGMALASLREKIGCDGLVDDVRISSTIRKIEKVPDAPLPLDQNTIGLWRFDHADAADVDPAWTPRPAEGDAPPWEKATDKDWIDPRFQKMDTGPFLNATFAFDAPSGRQTVFKGTAIKVGDKGEGAVLYDRNQMRFAAAWTGGWLNHSSRRFALLNTPSPVGEVMVSTESGLSWATPQGEWKTDHPATAPLPREIVHFRGMHVHGDRIVLSYTVRGVPVLESPSLESKDGMSACVRTYHIGPTTRSLRVLIHQLPPALRKLDRATLGSGISYKFGEQAFAMTLKGNVVLNDVYEDGKYYVNLERRQEPVSLKLVEWRGKATDVKRFEALERVSPKQEDLRTLTRPGPARWKPLATRGEIGKSEGPFAIDTLTIPYDNPYKALFFVTGVDAMPDGSLAVCTAHGDVWLVSGIDDKLEKIVWTRHATGLYQPLGLKVVDGKVVVLERGQLTRLHDNNNDGEADFYECINGDWHTAGGEHSFDTCLETDPVGDFYFFKTGDTHTPTGGCLLRVTGDGRKLEVYATGFRHPIGMGMSPKGVLTGADQEGNWMPATRIDEYKRGGFYGDMRAHHRKEPPKTFDPPLLWLPRQVDNSAGGQVWVPEGKWGPLSERMLHLSFGKCRMNLILRQEVDGLAQGGAVDLGVQFLSGSARGRFNPKDGHLYVVGLNGWQTAAQRDGSLQRVRWTGKPLKLPLDLAVHADGLKVTFSEKLDAKQAEEVKRWQVERWNYKWSGDYGSQRWSVSHPERVGQDRMPVKSAKLLADGKSVFLTLDDIKPSMQMQLRWNLATASGEPISGVLHHTLHFPAPAFRP